MLKNSASRNASVCGNAARDARGRGFDSRRLHLIGFRNPSRSTQGPSAPTGGPCSFGARIAGFPTSGVAGHDEIAGLTPPLNNRQKSRTGPRVSKSRDTPQVSPAMEVVGNQQVAKTAFFPV